MSLLRLRILRWQIVWLIAVAAIAAGDSVVLAANRFVSTLPASGKPTKGGLLLKIDPSRINGIGYRPVWVEAQSTPPPIGDRTFTITLSIDRYGLETSTVSANLELPAGAGAASITIPVPQFGWRNQLAIAVAEDGHEIADLAGTISIGADFWGSASASALLHVSESSLPTDSDAFFGKLAQLPGISAAQNAVQQWRGTSSGPIYLASRSLAEMPEEWIDLTALDFVAMSSDELVLMAQTAPRAWQAVRDWTAAGGNLCVYGAGDRFERLADIDGHLGDRYLGGRAPAAQSDPGPADDLWTDCDPAVLANLDESVLNSMPVVEMLGENQFAPQIVTELKDFVGHRSAGDALLFRWRALQLGRVVILPSNDPFPTAADPSLPAMVQQWIWIRATLGTNRSSWTQRHGVSFDDGNPDFWNLLIPGVGLPPVTAYRVLITLFVILIGPVNYLVLRRLRRLHFLLFIVPASAALVTVALLGYALTCDGLGTRLRARSYTLLDQRGGQAVTWSRLSYYAALAPYGGLTFPRDTAVYPFEYEHDGNSNNYRHRTMALDEEQHLASGWLPSRTLTQFLAVRSGPERKRLEITPEKNALQVANRLQTRVAQAVIADRSGRLYYLTGLAAGETAIVEPLPTDPAAGGQPVIPAAFNAALTQRRLGDAINPSIRTSSLLGMSPHNYNAIAPNSVGQATSLLEQSLGKCEHAGSGSPAPPLPGSYLAIVDASDPALLGVADAQEVGSLHVIEGKW